MTLKKIWSVFPKQATKRKGNSMSVKKYRLYLLMITLVVIIVGALTYLYFSDQEKSYQDGTLVQTDYAIEEVLL